jgi:chromosome partitioning protein
MMILFSTSGREIVEKAKAHCRLQTVPSFLSSLQGWMVWTLGLIDDRVQEASTINEKLAAFVVLNRASPNPKDNDASEAREAIVACNTLRLAEVMICDRVAVKRAAPAGLTVGEYKPFDPKAAHEITQLYKLVFAQRR